MSPDLASHLIDLYAKGLEKGGWKIEKLETASRYTTLIVYKGKKKKVTKDYRASVSDQPLDSQVAVLRQAYWELIDHEKVKAL